MDIVAIDGTAAFNEEKSFCEPIDESFGSKLMTCTSVEAALTMGRIASLMLCYPSHDNDGINPVLPWGRSPRLRFRVGEREGSWVNFPFTLVPPAGGPDRGKYSTVVGVDTRSKASAVLAEFGAELQRLVASDRVVCPWQPAEEQKFRSLLRLSVDENTKVWRADPLQQKLPLQTGIEAITKGCFATIDVELHGLWWHAEGECWRPILRATQVVVYDGVGVHIRPRRPVHVDTLKQPVGATVFDFRGTRVTPIKLRN